MLRQEGDRQGVEPLGSSFTLSECVLWGDPGLRARSKGGVVRHGFLECPGPFGGQHGAGQAEMVHVDSLTSWLGDAGSTFHTEVVTGVGSKKPVLQWGIECGRSQRETEHSWLKSSAVPSAEARVYPLLGACGSRTAACGTHSPGGEACVSIASWSHGPGFHSALNLIRMASHLLAIHRPHSRQASSLPPATHTRRRRDVKWWAFLSLRTRALELIYIWASWLNKLFCAFALLQTSGSNEISSTPHYWFIIRITWAKQIQSHHGFYGWTIELTGWILFLPPPPPRSSSFIFRLFSHP